MPLSVRLTDKYIFDTQRANKELNLKSPYYVGSAVWNDLPKFVQDIDTKASFKCKFPDFI